jgi:hypothetical protein
VLAPIPRAVSFRDAAGWFVNSGRLVIRKPHYWIPFAVLLFASWFAITLVPIAGNYLRTFYGGFCWALALALAHTQVSEGGISVRRAFSLLAPAFPALLRLCAFEVAIFAFIDLPVIRMIATDAEFEVYAFSRLENGQARLIVDLVHTTVVTLASLVFEFAIPLAILGDCSALTALRKSLEAFLLAPAVYVAFGLATVVIPHTLATTLGIAGILLFLAVVTLLLPAQYFMFASAFAQGDAVDRPPAGALEIDQV